MRKMNMRFSVALVLVSVIPIVAHAERSTDPEQVRLMMERAQLQVRAELDARLEAEARAPIWAARMERRISRRLLALEGFDSQSLSVTCKSTFCRVEIDPYTVAQEAQLATEMWEVLEDLPDINPKISRITMNVRFYLLHATKFE